MLRLLRPTLFLLCLTACTAEPSCVDSLGRACRSSADCDNGDGCREVVGRGFFCVPPDGSGVRIVNSSLSPVVLTEGTAEGGITVRNGRLRSLPRAAGITEDGITVVEGDLR